MAPLTSILELRSVRGTGGGPEKTILFGAKLADTTRFRVTVCYIRDLRDDVFGIDERAGKLGIDYIEVRERNSWDVGVWQQLKTVVKDRSIDIVHAHDYKTDLFAWLLARRLNTIPLSTAHGWTGDTWRERSVYYPLSKRLVKRFPGAIAVSSEIKEELVRCGARSDRVTVILNSIDPAAFRRTEGVGDQVRASLGYGPEDIVIGAVGRLERQKRFDLLLAALAKCLTVNPRLRLAIVGDGSLRDELTKEAQRLGVTARCDFLGHRNDTPALYQAFNLFVQSSEYEGTPNVVLEAMATETPLVATDVGGTRELAIPDVHARIVPSRDVEALQAAITDVIAHPQEARARAVAARARIETDLSFEVRTRRLEALYTGLMAQRKHRASHA